jgi:hypothetical protein
MAYLIITEWALAVVAWLVFIADYRRTPWWRSATGRQMMAASIVALGEALTLLAVGLGLPVPLWVFAIGYGAADIVVIRWIVLRWRARRDERKVRGG